MRKIVIIALTLTLTVLAAGCSNDTNSADVVDGNAVAQDVPEKENTTISTVSDGDAVGGWGDDELGSRYWGMVDDMAIVDKIVGSKEGDKYFDEAIEPNKWAIGRDAPLVYSAIMHFGVNEASFREENDRSAEFYREHGLESRIYTEEEISALYCGDKDEMNRRLMAPYAFYTGERVLRANEVMMLDVDTIVAAGIDMDALHDYCNRMRVEIPKVPDSDVKWYEKKLDEMEAKIEEARPLMERPDSERPASVSSEWYVRTAPYEPDTAAEQEVPKDDISKQETPERGKPSPEQTEPVSESGDSAPEQDVATPENEEESPDLPGR